MNIIPISTIAKLKNRLAEKGVFLHLTDACGSQSGEIAYPDTVEAGERAEIRREIADFLAGEGFAAAFSKRGDSFWTRQGCAFWREHHE